MKTIIRGEEITITFRDGTVRINGNTVGYYRNTKDSFDGPWRVKMTYHKTKFVSTGDTKAEMIDNAVSYMYYLASQNNN